jgi:hypothetical protein
VAEKASAARPPSGGNEKLHLLSAGLKKKKHVLFWVDAVLIELEELSTCRVMSKMIATLQITHLQQTYLYNAHIYFLLLLFVCKFKKSTYLYSPSHSLDLNPTENTWASN